MKANERSCARGTILNFAAAAAVAQLKLLGAAVCLAGVRSAQDPLAYSHHDEADLNSSVLIVHHQYKSTY